MSTYVRQKLKTKTDYEVVVSSNAEKALLAMPLRFELVEGEPSENATYLKWEAE